MPGPGEALLRSWRRSPPPLPPRTPYLCPGSFPGPALAAQKARPRLGQVGKGQEHRHSCSLSVGFHLFPQELNVVDLNEVLLALTVPEAVGDLLGPIASFGGQARSRHLPALHPCRSSGNSMWCTLQELPVTHSVHAASVGPTLSSRVTSVSPI